MKNFKSFIFSAAFISSLLFSSASIADNGSNTNFAGNTQTLYPVVNNSSQTIANYNSSYINAALALGGSIDVECPIPGPVYLGATLVEYSNTRLNMSSSCTPTGIAGTHELLENFAASVTRAPWTVTSLNSGAGTTGPFSIIGSSNTNPWVTGTAYSQSAINNSYVTNAGNIYWLATASCTSGATAPTGTGTGISDGACSWNYVTTDQEFTTGAKITATVYWPSHGQVVGNAVAITPVPDVPNNNNFWSGTQTAGTNGALADSAFFGTFPVTAINDSNWITIALNRPASTPFSGAPMRIKQADVNLAITGGANWNYNYPTNTNTGSGLGNTTSMDIVYAWFENLTIDGVNVTNTAKYGIYLMGTNADIDHTLSSNTLSDRIKIYGPSSSITVENSYGPGGGDDIVSLQTQDTSGFASYLLGCGDITEITLRHITSDSGLILAVYPTQQYLKMDDILIDDYQIRNSVNKAYRGAITIFGGATITTGEPIIGNLTLRRGSSMNSGGGMPLVSTYNGGSSSTGFTVNNLVIDGATTGFVQQGSSSTGQIFSTDVGASNVSSGVIVNKLTIAHVKSYVGPTGSTADATVTLTSGTFNDVELEDSYIGAITASLGFGIYLNGATVDHIGISNNTFDNVSAATRLFTATTVDLVGNHLKSTSPIAGVVINVTGTTENLSRNWMSNGSYGMIRINGTYTQTIHSTGDNTLLNGSLLYVAASGTPVTTLLGGTDLASIGIPTVNSCGSGSSLGTNSNNLNGIINVPAATTSCIYNFTSNAYPVTPRDCQATVNSTTAIAVGCLITWTSATSGTFSVNGTSIGGQSINYSINP